MHESIDVVRRLHAPAEPLDGFASSLFFAPLLAEKADNARGLQKCEQALPQELVASRKLITQPLLPTLEMVDQSLHCRSADDHDQEQLEVEQGEKRAEDEEASGSRNQGERRMGGLNNKPAVSRRDTSQARSVLLDEEGIVDRQQARRHAAADIPADPRFDRCEKAFVRGLQNPLRQDKAEDRASEQDRAGLRIVAAEQRGKRA
jgi:hypothetical protein